MKIAKTFVVLLMVLSACEEAPNDLVIMDPVEWDKTPYMLDVGDFPPPDIREDNPLTVQGVKLGRMLFYEPMLSKGSEIYCGTCHEQRFSFADSSRFSTGVNGDLSSRQTMAVFNLAYQKNGLFWDGRDTLIRDQALRVIRSSKVMDQTLDQVIKKLSHDPRYRDQFARAFGTSEITGELIGKAIEQYLSTIISNKSRYDFLKKDGDSSDWTMSEKRGMRLFYTDFNAADPDKSGAGCYTCHSGFNLENNQYANNGLDPEGGSGDSGRMAHTGNPSDLANFRVPTLRNIEKTSPYMHDGRFRTLQEVIEHYNSGVKYSSTLHPELKKSVSMGLMLSDQDKADLVAFLKTLTDRTITTNEDYSNPF